MRERIILVGGVVLLVGLLVGLNALNYSQREKIPDSESNPDRSTFNTGPTGTRAFYDLALSLGMKVERWRTPVEELKTTKNNDISTFVVIGATRKDLEESETRELLDWVSKGGNLVLIDRDPNGFFLKTSAPWALSVVPAFKEKQIEDKLSLSGVDPANSTEMIGKEAAALPKLPSVYTKGINAIQPSRFASSLESFRIWKPKEKPAPGDFAPGKGSGSDDVPVISKPAQGVPGDAPVPPPPPVVVTENDSNANTVGEEDYDDGADNANSARPDAVSSSRNDGAISGPIDEVTREGTETEKSEGDYESVADEFQDGIDYEKLAPVVYYSNDNKKLAVEVAYDSGTIFFLTDPYIVSNGGIRHADNASFALTVIGKPWGRTVFDEYHQGYGKGDNQLLNYFSGTPVVPVMIQLFVFLGLLMYSKGRRFARPLPAPEPSRISNLEYIGAMAQLKKSTKAYDLAVENIFGDFLARVSRLLGIDGNKFSNTELADMVSHRTGRSREELERIFETCADIKHGSAAKKNKVLEAVSELRKIEKELGLPSRGTKRSR
ncbi:MAG: DUF4350 domain-containing protein [Pyrinomonadaceae bacterium]